MFEETNGKPSTTYYVIAGIFLAWNLIGLMFYYQQMTLTPEMMAAHMTDMQIAHVSGTPTWANAGYAIAVNAGVLGAILLLLRKVWAVPFFVISLLGALVQDFDAFVLRNAIEAWGTSALFIPLTVIVICVIEIWYSRTAKGKGWLD